MSASSSIAAAGTGLGLKDNVDYGMLDIIQDHPTYRKVDGSWKTFKYSEPFSRYSCAKAFEEVWWTKWWPMHQSTFICLVAEVNAVQFLDRRKREVTTPQLDFCQKLAEQMLMNMINIQVVPEIVHMRTRTQQNVQHQHLKHGIQKWSGIRTPAASERWRQIISVFSAVHAE